jgi:hypothetical protein
MQKVEGSSPFIRFMQAPLRRVLSGSKAGRDATGARGRCRVRDALSTRITAESRSLLGVRSRIAIRPRSTRWRPDHTGDPCIHARPADDVPGARSDVVAVPRLEVFDARTENEAPVLALACRNPRDHLGALALARDRTPVGDDRALRARVVLRALQPLAGRARTCRPRTRCYGPFAIVRFAGAYIVWLTRFRMLPSGSLNHTALKSAAMCTSPSRVVSGRSS